MYPSDNIAAHENATVAPKSNGENQIGLDLTTGGDRVELATLVRFDTIVVRTANSEYRIFLLDPETGRALLEGGRQFTEPVEGRVIGSSFGGITLLTGWICVGLRLEACANDKYIRTSPVQSLSVEHKASPELASSTY